MFWSHKGKKAFLWEKKVLNMEAENFCYFWVCYFMLFLPFFFSSWILLFMTCSPLPHYESMMASTLSSENVYISQYNNDNYLPPGWCVGSWCFSNWNGRGLFFLSIRYLGLLWAEITWKFSWSSCFSLWLFSALFNLALIFIIQFFVNL